MIHMNIILKLFFVLQIFYIFYWHIRIFLFCFYLSFLNISMSNSALNFFFFNTKQYLHKYIKINRLPFRSLDELRFSFVVFVCVFIL